MKHYILLLPILFLTACSGNYRVKNIVSFTNALHADAKDVTIAVPARQHITNWDGESNNININANDLPTKVKFEKLKLSADISANPIIIDEKIIVLCSNGSVTAFSGNDYSKIWSINVLGKKNKTMAFGGGIVYSDGKLYVTNGSQMLDILNPENGRRVMSKKFPDIIAARPLIHENLILLLTLGNQLYAMDKNTGTVVWDHAGNPETLTYGNIAAPAIDAKGRIFVAYSSGQIYLLNPQNGAVLWQYDLSTEEHMPGFLPVNIKTKPILEGDNIYLADSLGQFYKFDTSNGSIVWKKPIQDVQTTNNIGNAIFITTNGRQAAALDKKNGRVIWATDIVDDLKAIKKSHLKTTKLQEDIAPPKKEDPNLQSKYPLKKLWAKMKSHISEKKAIPKKVDTGYDRSKLRPIDFVTSVLMNDLFTLYTSKGSVYYLSPLDGQILDQKDLKTSLDFVAISDKVVLVSGKKILVGK